MATTLEDPALAAYESLAPFYDLYTEGYGYEAWLSNIEKILVSHGLAGGRLLDVGCGTGKSFMRRLEPGYEGPAWDLSPAMVEGARAAAAGTGTEVVVADARALPVLG